MDTARDLLRQCQNPTPVPLHIHLPLLPQDLHPLNLKGQLEQKDSNIKKKKQTNNNMAKIIQAKINGEIIGYLVQMFSMDHYNFSLAIKYRCLNSF